MVKDKLEREVWEGSMVGPFDDWPMVLLIVSVYFSLIGCSFSGWVCEGGGVWRERLCEIV